MPEAAPQAEVWSPGQIFGLETTLLKVCFTGVPYFIVASGHVGPLLHKAGVDISYSSFQSKDLSLAAALSLRRSLILRCSLSHTIAWVRGVLGAPPPDGSAVASYG